MTYGDQAFAAKSRWLRETAALEKAADLPLLN